MATVTATMVNLAAALNVDATLDSGGGGDGGSGDGGGGDFHNDCSGETPAFCASLQRLPCSNDTRPGTCGGCADGELTSVLIDSSQHSPCVSLYASDPTLAPTAVPTVLPTLLVS